MFDVHETQVTIIIKINFIPFYIFQSLDYSTKASMCWDV